MLPHQIPPICLLFSLLVTPFLYPTPANGFDLFIDADYGLNVLKWVIFGNEPLFFIKDSAPFTPVLENKLLALITLTTTNVMRLTWTTTENETINYIWQFNSSDINAMSIPYLSIPHSGRIPKREVFNLTFPCTGRKQTTPFGTVLLNYTFANGESRTVTTGSRVRCEKTIGDGGSSLWIIGAALGAALIITIVLFVTICVARKRDKSNLSQLERQITVLKEESERRGSESHYSNMSTRRETVEMRLKLANQKAKNRKTEMVMKLRENWFESLEECIIEHNKIVFGEELGKGAFGFVFKGTVSGIGDSPDEKYTVALKTMKDATSIDDMSRFLSEGIVMKDFKHPHVMGLIGVCFPEEDPPVIVLPFMANGDLHSYLKKTRSSVSSINDSISLPYTTLLKFIKQIASGMEYLASQKFVHRDLATRNCMLDGNMDVKVGDFGLAKEMHEDLYYRLGTPTKLPVKWMAIESLNDQIFTLQTDVWAYGITIWEILSEGKTPYPGVANYELTEYLMKGLRLQKPDPCSDWMYELMRSCWNKTPSNRPTFSEIVVLLEEHSRNDIDSDVEYQNLSPTSKASSAFCSPSRRLGNNSTSPTENRDDGYAELKANSVFEDESNEDQIKKEKTMNGTELEPDEGYLKMDALKNESPSRKGEGEEEEEEYLKMNAMSQKEKGRDDETEHYVQMTLQREARNDVTDSDDDEYLKMELKKRPNLQTDGDEEYMKMDGCSKAGITSKEALVNNHGSEV